MDDRTTAALYTKGGGGRFNGFYRTGVDENYGRGCRAFDRAHGEPTVKPNPNLGAIEQGPFSALAMYPNAVGTAGSVAADEYARVLRADGSVIRALLQRLAG